MLSGNPDEARIVAEELVEVNPNLMKAWALLVSIHIQENDQDALKRCADRLMRSGGQSFLTAVAEGYLALMDNDFEGATGSFEEALAVRPSAVPVLEWLLRIDMLLGRKKEAESRVLSLLRIDPGNAFGNHIMASLQMAAGENDLARDSLRRSLKTDRNAAVLNDLAWLLQKRGEYEDAEQYVKEALKIDKRLHHAWDTLGVIFTKTDRMPSAEKAFKHSLSLSEGSPEVFLHLAELYEKKGDRAEVSKILKMLSGKEDRMSESARSRLLELRFEL